MTGGKKSTTEMSETQAMATQFIGRPQRPSVKGPSMNWTSELYHMRAKMTATYERSSAGAVMLKMATIVSVDPIPIRFSALQKTTTSQTELMGVCVRWLILDQKLDPGF